jgi:hypothetical protein
MSLLGVSEAQIEAVSLGRKNQKQKATMKQLGQKTAVLISFISNSSVV